MILGEVFPGEDAEVLVEAIKSDWSGEDEDTIQDLAVWVKHYKETAVQATGATAVWNSDMGQYLITIPSAYVPASGIFDICVKGSDIDDVLIRLQVNTGDAQLTAIKATTDLLTLAAINEQVDTAISALSNIAAVGAEKIVPTDKYAFDASAKTLTFSSPYDTLTVEQVTFIKNLTTNYIIWDCRYAGYQTLPVRFGAAPNTNVLSFDSSDSDAANADKIMIVVNQV